MLPYFLSCVLNIFRGIVRKALHVFFNLFGCKTKNFNCFVEMKTSKLIHGMGSGSGHNGCSGEKITFHYVVEESRKKHWCFNTVANKGLTSDS